VQVLADLCRQVHRLGQHILLPQRNRCLRPSEVTEHVSSDEGSQFVSTKFEKFLQSWGTDYQKDTKYDGSPDWYKISRALMQHLNTPMDRIKFSPAQLLFNRPIRDFQPIRPGQFRPAEVWVDCAEKRELAMRHRLSIRVVQKITTIFPQWEWSLIPFYGIIGGTKKFCKLLGYYLRVPQAPPF
jgi:hypothetical protein